MKHLYFLALGGGLLAGPTQAQTLISFAPVATYSIGTASPYPIAIATADVNGDGKPDLLLANNSGGSISSGAVSVQLNAGAGTFTAATPYSTGANTYLTAIVTADVNGDGKPDVLLANRFGSVGVLLGTGMSTGTLGPVVFYSTGIVNQPTDLAVADVNGDGQLDVVCTSLNNTAGVLLGTGTGSFGTVTAYNTGPNSYPQGVAVADVNRDGKPDLLVANTDAANVGVLLGTGTGTFGAIATYPLAANSQPFRLVVADMNGDGQPDLLTPNRGTDAVSVLLGTGTGTFGPAIDYYLGPGHFPYALAVGDIDGDGKLDAITANYGNNSAGVVLGTGTGSFNAYYTFSTGPGGGSLGVATADVNSDGGLDILTANFGSSTSGVLLNTTPTANTGVFAPVVTYGTGPGSTPYSIAAADVNGDGRFDLLTANQGSSTAAVQLGTGTGAFGAAATYSTGPGSNPTGIAVADVNRDGRPDLLTANQASSTAGVLLNTGAGSFAPASTYSTGTGSAPFDIAVADVNGDSKPDLLTSNSGTNTVGVLLGTGTGTFGTVMAYSTGANSQPTSIAVGDVNRDGKPDILTTNQGAVGVLLGTGSGTFGAVTTYSLGTGNNPTALAVADVNGDGQLDLLTANYSSNTVSVLLSTGLGTFGTVASYSTGAGSGPISIAVGDANGDGKPDLLTANALTHTIGVLLNVGAGTFKVSTAYALTTYSTGAGSKPTDIAVADVNGDGKPDVLTANFNGNATGVLLGSALPAPTLTSLSPASGPVGTSVTLTGTNLTGVTSVSFNGTAASTFLVVSATSLTATVPAGATSGPVAATTGSGTATGPAFTVTTTPTVTTAIPAVLTSTGATLGGSVTADGGAAVTERGVVYVAGTGLPTTANTKVVVGAGTGLFTRVITGLTTNTLYSVCAYATNTVGTSYGTVQTFTTAQPLAMTGATALAVGVQLYPNPSPGQLLVRRPATASTTAVLCNALGQLVRQVALPTAETKLVLTDLPTGVYYLHLTVDGQAVVLPLVLN